MLELGDGVMGVMGLGFDRRNNFCHCNFVGFGDFSGFGEVALRSTAMGGKGGNGFEHLVFKSSGIANFGEGVGCSGLEYHISQGRTRKSGEVLLTAENCHPHRHRSEDD